MEKQFDGKVALVTGAGSGIGKSTALLYAAQGAKVVVSDINEAHGQAVVEEIKGKGGDAFFIKADVGNATDCERLVKETVKQYGKLDVACNNAGIAGESNLVGDVDINNWNKVININLNSVFYCMKYEIEAMLANGGGSIVNMASILGQAGFANSSAYVAAKHGVVGLTKTAGIEYGTKGIRINAVGPGFIKTPLLKESPDSSLEDALVPLHPIGRLGEPEEVAELVIWLTSDKASFVTATYYAVDGGYLAR
ncbi:NAD(P)-dependent dehydrogenase, short-chain alcohol dehydrogenase family [Filimonas lacunae]|uniref:NAD(P)-dependent dehydrogenase, short-chain alcohol dehydrogenase family n=1 Tax=Filimonas lacunae TaxID=477680 RepID=A0A173MCI3_9BACT|nr:SDR family oxidoreductase [Filimonas lacunae]BAV05236.1 D-beta-hydroxybutyrate dehydrogenase [Filimonas lacunae]SIT22464.1 NAD(P)-dependent dehydrogenase, short-chain alcohol dehydrogenase family [Filimonas lacunae]